MESVVVLNPLTVVCEWMIVVCHLMPSRRSVKAIHIGESQMTLTQFVRAMPPRGLGGRTSFDTHLTPTPSSSRASPIDLRSPSPPHPATKPGMNLKFNTFPQFYDIPIQR
jgi:hypothetical protein